MFFRKHFRRFCYRLFVFLCIFPLSVGAQSPKVEQLKTELAAATTDTSRLRLLLELSALFQQQLPADVVRYSEEALVLAREQDDQQGQMKAYYGLAVGKYLGGKNEEALPDILEAVQIAEVLQLGTELIDAYNFTGTVLDGLSRTEESLEFMFKALDLAREQNNTSRELTALGNIGQVYAYHDEREKGVSYYRQALNLALEEEDTTSAAIIYNNLGTFSTDPDTAINYQRKSLALFEYLNYADGVAHACDNLGANLVRKGNYTDALSNLKRAQSIWEETGFTQGLISIYGNLGSAYGYLDQLDSARYYWEKSLTIGEEAENYLFLKDINLQISELYEKKGYPDEALHYFKQSSVYKDSIFNQQKAEELVAAETRFETEQKEKRLTEQDLLIARQRLILVGSLLAVALLLGLLLFLRYRQRLRQQKAELALQLEQAEAEQLRELDRLRSNFFANISHEFRTPLTLILSPLEQLMEGKLQDQAEKYYRIIHRNSRRLLHLVNQLLDLSRLESGRMQLQVRQGDLSKALRTLAFAFESLAVRRQIDYRIELPEGPVEAWFDRLRLEQVVNNLLSNAFKFTPEEGAVTLQAAIEPRDGMRYLHLTVTDTGIGIPAAQLPRIFERFYQTAQGATEVAGSGIGLALTKELVELQNGRIEVISEEGSGTTFTVLLPVEKSNFKPGDLQEAHPEIKEDRPPVTAVTEATIVAASEESAPAGLQPSVLVVEDNLDLQAYIGDQLSGRYRVLKAANGREGLAAAQSEMPDLIITDVMMPEMDGVELTRLLRADTRTSHVPVIMLTAKAEREDKLEGLETGVDDYLTKPFDAEELRVRVANLVEQRRRLRTRFAKEITLQPSEVATTSVDEQFLRKVLTTIEDNMEEETFSVVELADKVGMSRSQLHRKLKALLDKSPNQVIRDLRLQRARSLLEQGAGNASEVAFMVGFSSPAYFSKCFRDAFGFSPSEVIRGG